MYQVIQSNVNAQPQRLWCFLSCYPAFCSPPSCSKKWGWNVLKEKPQRDYSVSNPAHYFPIKMCHGVRKTTGFSLWSPWYTERWITWNTLEFLSKKVFSGFVWASSCLALWFWKRKFKAKCRQIKKRSLWKNMSSLQTIRISSLYLEVGEGWKDKIHLNPTGYSYSQGCSAWALSILHLVHKCSRGKNWKISIGHKPELWWTRYFTELCRFFCLRMF